MHASVRLTLDLCKIDSTTGNEKAAIDFLEDYLTKAGWKTARQPVGPEKGRDNLWAFSEEKHPDIIFCTHLDTVPPFYPPTLSEDGKVLFGRGVCDAKGIAACLILAAEKLKEKNISIGLLLVVGEETTSDGAKAAATYGVKAKYVVVGEPTQLKLIRAMKGVLAFELQSKGIAAHSAYPEMGRSAIHQLIEDTRQLLQLQWPKSDELGDTTCNIGLIKGGRAPNVIADEASAKGVVRVTVKIEDIIKLIQSKLHPETKLAVLSNSDPQHLTILDGFETDVVSFGSDVPYVRSIGEPLLIGPGSILDAHTAYEQIKVEDLERAIELYVSLGEKLACK